MKSLFYLSHPFDSREYIRKWELEIKDKLPFGLVNPFYSQISIEKWKEGDKTNEEYYSKLDNWKEIVETDMNLILNSEGIIAVIDGSLSYGTILEIMYAKINNKKVILICTNKQENHPWLKYCSNQIFTSFKQFEDNLYEIF